MTLLFLARLKSAEAVQSASPAVQPLISPIPCKTLNKLIPACYPYLVFAKLHSHRSQRSGNVRTCQHSNAQFASRMHLRDVSTRLVPNSHGIIPFTDPHPLNPVLSYRYKNIGGQGALPGLQRSKVQPSNVSTCLDHHLFTSLLRYVLTPTSFPYLVTSLPPYFLFSKSFPCHTSENSPVSPTIATLPKRGVSNPSLCHTSETPGGASHFR